MPRARVIGIVNLGLCVAGLICFAAFSWAVKRHFRLNGQMPRGMKRIIAASFLGFAWFGWRLGTIPAPAWWWGALALMLLGLALFFWAILATRQTPPALAFDPEPPSILLQNGPYRFVRHPFYLAYLLFWTGTALSTAGWLPWLAPFLMSLIYSYAAIREEGKFAHSSLAGAYAAYQRQTGMFLPRLSCLLPE